MKLALPAVAAAALTLSVVLAHTAAPVDDNGTAILAAQGFYSDVTAVSCASIAPGTPVSAYSGTPQQPIGTAPSQVLPVCRW